MGSLKPDIAGSIQNFDWLRVGSWIYPFSSLLMVDTHASFIKKFKVMQSTSVWVCVSASSECPHMIKGSRGVLVELQMIGSLIGLE